MFTGIIESTGIIRDILVDGSNTSFWIASPISHQFKVDQSVSHNGVCLTVEEIRDSMHRVTAIDETLSKTTLGTWQTGQTVNLERSLTLQARLDGHFVQGHVDGTGTCVSHTEKNGSFEYTIRFPAAFANLVIEKGSICMDGISLTAFNVTRDSFTVAIIPYTFQHTNIHQLKEGVSVNLEFDILGKYMARSIELARPS